MTVDPGDESVNGQEDEPAPEAPPVADEIPTLLRRAQEGDSSTLPKLRQVGKSGQKVKPKLYLALGVSGAPEHLEGMSKSDLIIAVNTDPKAPIFNVAHFGATCDLFDLVANLSERLQAASGR